MTTNLLPPPLIHADDIRIERVQEGSEVVTYYYSISTGKLLPIQPARHFVPPANLDPPPE
jgi:hypothetical protein